MSEIFPAATVVLIRDTDRGLEVLMLRRSKELKFAGGAWVFPGGRIDAEDYGDNPGDTSQAAYVAAVRETKEEAGLTLSASDLLYFSHWTAPPETPKRFATWFFVATLDHHHKVVVDGGEIDKHRWYLPQEAVDAHQDKRIKLMPPTFVTLTELCQCSSTSAAMQMYNNRVIPEFKPKITLHHDIVCVLYPGDAGYAAGDSSIQGDARHRLWMLDSGWKYEKAY
jgi:8-oxo-dGTP pyrophosphatase MutT (NUDIX family)